MSVPAINNQINAQHRINYLSAFIQAVNHRPELACKKIKTIMMLFPWFLVSELDAFHFIHDPAVYESRRNQMITNLNNELSINPSERMEYLVRVKNSIYNSTRTNLLTLFSMFEDSLANSNDNVAVTVSVTIIEIRNEPPVITEPFPLYSLPMELIDHIMSFLPNDRNLFVDKQLTDIYIYNRTKAIFPSNKTMTNDNFLSLPKKIKILKLGPIESINDDSLERLESLPLKELTLVESAQFLGPHANSRILEAVKSKSLTSLCISQCFIGAFPIGFVFQAITQLDISGLDLPETQLALILAEPRSFIKLNLAGNDMSSKVPVNLMERLFKCGKNVSHLNLAFTSISHDDVKLLCRSMKKIEELDLSHIGINPSFSTMEHLTLLTQLKTLTINGWFITSIHVLFSVHFASLRKLDVRLCSGIIKEQMIQCINEAGKRIQIADNGNIILENTEIISSDYRWFEENNIFTEIILDILNKYTKRIKISTLCRTLFPPLNRAIHRTEFLRILRTEVRCQLLELRNDRYLIEPNFFRKIYQVTH